MNKLLRCLAIIVIMICTYFVGIKLQALDIFEMFLITCVYLEYALGDDKE